MTCNKSYDLVFIFMEFINPVHLMDINEAFGYSIYPGYEQSTSFIPLFGAIPILQEQALKMKARNPIILTNKKSEP